MKTRKLSYDESVQRIRDVLDQYYQEKHLWPMKQVWLGQPDCLTSEQVKIAVVPMAMTLNLTSGNSGGRNLYDLLDLYIRDPAATEKINKIIIESGRQVFEPN